jgi:hypothetical protein
MKIKLCVLYSDDYVIASCKSVEFKPAKEKSYNYSDSWFIYYENDDGPGLNHIYNHTKEKQLSRLIRFLKTFNEYDAIRYTK